MHVNTTLGGGTSTAQGFFIEVFLTAQLIFAILMLAVEKHRSTYLAPLAIGVTFFLCELCGTCSFRMHGIDVPLWCIRERLIQIGVFFTGGSLNFARSLGPAVINRSFPGYFWIYFLGPVCGSAMASGFYYLLKRMRWQDCNPGQDHDGTEKAEQALRTNSDSGLRNSVLSGPDSVEGKPQGAHQL